MLVSFKGEKVRYIRVFDVNIISALAGIFLKFRNVYFFSSTFLGTILNNSDILFGSNYKRKN